MMSDGLLLRIRRAVRERRYRFSDHALDEADADDLSEQDVLNVLLTGSLDSVYYEDTRGPRCVVRGDVVGIEVDVVCRFQPDGKLLIIITVYVVD